MKLGTKRNGMNMAYPSATKEEGEDEIIHQTVSLPMKLLDGKKVKKGDRVCIELEGTLTGIHDDEYSSNFTMKAEEGECKTGGKDDDGDDEPGTILGGESEK